jgi:putative Ca2+/H+ antiporter (TMEM165/GDT1 family)
VNWSAALRAFLAVFPAELPDKTMIAVVVLVTRHKRPLPVWLGAAAAFTLHVAVAVTAGRLLTVLPDILVSLAAALLFGIGAVVLWREASHNGRAGGSNSEAAVAPTAWAAFVSSFAVVGVAEWGDLTQFATAGIAASSGAPSSVAVGALAALWAVAALAAGLGQTLVTRLPVHALQRTAAVVFAVLAVSSLLTAVRS